MDPIEARLQKCFSRVFPDAGAERIRSATVETIPQWDSLATITLLSLVREEFGIVPDMDRFEDFTSFQGMAGYIREATAES